MKKPTPFIFLFTLLTISLSAQDKGLREKSMHFGLSLAPKVNWFLSDNKTLSDPGKSYAFSIYANAYYDLSSRVQLRSGLGLHRFETSSVDYSLNFGCDHDGQGGFDPFNSWAVYDIPSIYLGIPLDAKIKLAGDANHLYWRMGAELLFRLAQKDDVAMYECGMEPSDNIQENFLYVSRENNLLLQSGLGYEWKIKKQKLFIEPMIAYKIFKVFEDVGITSSLIVNGSSLQAGVLTGVVF
jgi:hypothetical protein